MKIYFFFIIFLLSCEKNSFYPEDKNKIEQKSFYNTSDIKINSEKNIDISFIDLLAEYYLKEEELRRANGDLVNAKYCSNKSESIASSQIVSAANPEYFGLIPSDVLNLQSARNILLKLSNEKNTIIGTSNSFLLANAYYNLDLWFMELEKYNLELASVFRDNYLQNIRMLINLQEDNIKADLENLYKSNYNICYSCRKIVNNQYCNGLFFENLSIKPKESFNYIIERFTSKLEKIEELKSISITYFRNPKNKKIIDQRVKAVKSKLISFDPTTESKIKIFSAIPDDQQFITNNKYLENGIEICFEPKI